MAMDKVQRSGSSFALCHITVLIIFACFPIGNASKNNSVTWSRYHSINTKDTVDHSIVTKVYNDTKSILRCAMKCTSVTVESFYYIDDADICYCNNQTDNNIVADGGGSLVYGYLVRPGTEAECQDIYNAGFRTDGDFITSTGKKILCNLTSLGWLVFQRRLDGSVEFQREWVDYVTGFGDTAGEFWLGLEELHQLTKSGCELLVYLDAGPDNAVQKKGYARFSNFSVGSAATNYALYVDGFSGDVGDSLTYSSGCQFTTYDADHDNWSNGNCAVQSVGGWWYNGKTQGNSKVCHYSNLNSFYLGGQHQSLSGIRWQYPWGHGFSLLRTEMAIRCY